MIRVLSAQYKSACCCCFLWSFPFPSCPLSRRSSPIFFSTLFEALFLILCCVFFSEIVKTSALLSLKVWYRGLGNLSRAYNFHTTLPLLACVILLFLSIYHLRVFSPLRSDPLVCALASLLVFFPAGVPSFFRVILCLFRFFPMTLPLFFSYSVFF